MTRDLRYDLENQFDLQKEMACPQCGELVFEPDYICKKDDVQLVFYAKK